MKAKRYIFNILFTSVILACFAGSSLLPEAQGAYHWIQNDTWTEGDSFYQVEPFEFCTNYGFGDRVCTILDVSDVPPGQMIDKIGILVNGTWYDQFEFHVICYRNDDVLPNPGSQIDLGGVNPPFIFEDGSGFYILDLSTVGAFIDPNDPSDPLDEIVVCVMYMGYATLYDVDMDLCTDNGSIALQSSLIKKCEPFSSPWEFAEDYPLSHNVIIRAGWEIPDPTNTPIPTRTATPTRTPTPTSTMTGTPTWTPTVTETPLPTLTPTPTLTPSPTWTPTWTPTQENTWTPTATPTPTIPPHTFTPTQTPTMTATPTPTASTNLTATPTPTPTPSMSPSFTPSPTPTPTQSHTYTPYPTHTPEPTYTFPPTFTPTPSPSATFSMTPTPSPSPTPTMSPSTTVTPTPSNTFTMTPTNTPTNIPTSTPTATWTPTPVPTHEPYRLPFFDDFEGDIVWNPTAIYGDCLWHKETVRYSSFPHSWAYNTGSPQYNYLTGARNSCGLVSPLINLDGALNPKISFYDWIETEDRDDFDVCYMEISDDNGNTWTPLYSTYQTTGAWQLQGPFSLEDYLDEIIQVRFRFDTVDSQFNQFEGWYVDDVDIRDYPVESPTPTPYSGPPGVDLRLNGSMFYENDRYLLELDYLNPSNEPIPADVYLVLDVYGFFWFWPDWTETINSDYRVMTAQKILTEVIFDFTWPYYDGDFDNVIIWAAALKPGTSELIGNYDFVSFGCNR